MTHGRIGIILGGVMWCAGTLLAQEPSLAEVAKAQKAAKAKKTSSSKVIGDEEVTQLRARNHVGGPGTECDASCETSVRATLEEQGARMTDAQWADAFASGRNELETDSEWQDFFPGFQRELCQGSAAKAEERERLQEAGRKAAARVQKEAQETQQGLARVSDPSTDVATRQRMVRELRAKAVKFEIMKIAVDRAKLGCGGK
jgi:hypothetical protein